MAFERYNEHHRRSAPRYRSLREFRCRGTINYGWPRALKYEGTPERFSRSTCNVAVPGKDASSRLPSNGKLTTC